MPLNEKYLFQNRKALRVIRCIDWLLDLLPKRSASISHPKKILICNCAHLGDVVLSTSILAPLKKAFPEIFIGVVVGSWSKGLVAGHPLIDQVHIVDHWKANRSSASLWSKVKHYMGTRRQALKEIKNSRYEVAVDLCFYYPNLIPLLFQAKIPMRIGYISGGFGPLLTHPHRFVDQPKSAMDYFGDLFRYFFSPEKLSPYLTPLPEIGGLGRFGLEKNSYVLIHMGSGNAAKEWPHWKCVIKEVAKRGWKIVLTGKGPSDQRAIQEITREGPCVDLCDRLSLQEFVEVIAKARLYLGVDTGASHIAAAHKVPSIVVFHGTQRFEYWSIQTPSTTIFRI